MRVSIRPWIVCVVVVAWVGLAVAAPTAAQHYAAAEKAYKAGDFPATLGHLKAGLQVDPKHKPMLLRRAIVLNTLGDYEGALAAYQAALDAGLTGKQRTTAEETVADLREIIEMLKTTALEITVENGPADVYLKTRTLGVYCHAEPTCKKPQVPGEYLVIAERKGFSLATGRVTVTKGSVAKISIKLVDLPSPLVVRAPEGATITVDGSPYDPAAKVAGGPHRIAVTLAGHAEEQREVIAAKGEPLEVDIAPSPLFRLRVAPAGAELVLDDKQARVVDGSLALPPGPHVLVVRAPGHQERRIEIPADRPAEFEVVAELVALPPVRPPVRDPSPFTGRRKVALGVAGLGVVAAGAGIFLGLQSSSLEDDSFALCPDPTLGCRDAVEATDLNSRARSRALQANIAYGVAGAAVLGAAILWFTGAPERSDRVSISPRPDGLDIAVRF